MTSKEIEHFIDCLAYEDCTIMLYNRLYRCLGITYDSKEECCDMLIYEEDVKTHVYVRTIFDYTSNSCEDCMQHFLYDKYWDGKSFFEIAPDMEWV